METIVKFPNRDAVEDEALAWLIRLDGDKPLSASEERTFEQWLARSPAHRDAMKSLNAFWSNCNVLGEVLEPSSITVPSHKRIVTGLIASLWPAINFRGAALASALMVLALGVTLLVARPWDITASNGVYLTAVGQQKTVTLSDDSRIQLNTNSQIQVDYSDGYRNIRLLQGEVHFEVAKDPSKPFRVYAGSGRVQAVGTAFNVYLNKDQVEVLVTEGRVAVGSFLPLAARSPNHLPSEVQQTQATQMHEAENVTTTPIDTPTRDLYAASEVNGLGTIAAGRGVILKKTRTESPGTHKGSPKTETVVELVPTFVNNAKQEHTRLAWRQGLLIFAGESLEEAVEEIGRYTSVEIDIVDPALRAIEVGGQIRVADTDSMFKALEANFGLKIKRLSYNRVQIVAVEQ